MATSVLEIVKRTVPEQFHNEVEKIFESSKQEVERLRAAKLKYKRFRKNESPQPSCSDAEAEAERDSKAKAEALAIAKTIMKLWSSKMFSYAEKLILVKAVEEKHFEDKLLKFIYVFVQDEQGEYENDWIINDQDETIITLVWEIFKLKNIYEEISNHRSLIQKSYQRIRAFVPELRFEIIERHDVSKYAFSQAIGYALKFVHDIDHPIWKAACELHLQNEPHHPKTWGCKFTPMQKKQKLEEWTRDACDFGGGCPYGLNLASHRFESEMFPIPFLYESYIDMMAVEWERKKGQKPDISLSDLIYMDDKYLLRYSSEQRKIIADLVDRVIASDKSWQDVSLSDREMRLLSTLSVEKKGPIIFKLGFQKRSEIARQEKSLSTVSSQESIEKASFRSFCNTLATVVMDVWDNSFRKKVEHLILKRAIEEKFIDEKHLKWIFFAEKAVEKESESSPVSLSIEKGENLVQLIWEEYNMKEHFKQMKEHRHWIMQSYRRLSKFVPEVPAEVIERHDLSKFAFSQAVGYTLKWVHEIDSLVWKKACDLHLNAEPHHPQMWANRHVPDYKQSCLEAFLCISADGAKYGIQVSHINLFSENMAVMFLLESFIDMVGVEWERKKDKRDDITNSELVYMEEKFLNRYSEHDKMYLLNFMQKILNEDSLATFTST